MSNSRAHRIATLLLAWLCWAALARLSGSSLHVQAVQEIHPHRPRPWTTAGPAPTAGAPAMNSTVAVFGSISTAPGATAGVVGGDAAPTRALPEPMPAAASGAARAAPSSLQLQRRRDATLVVLLALLCGATDALFYQRYDCYANMMTGNTVKLGAALAAGAWAEAARFGALIAAYLAGCSLLPELKRRAAEGGDAEEPANATPAFNRRLLRAVAPVVCGLFLAADALRRAAHPALFLPTLALAFGLLNTATIDVTGAVTNAATGHISKVGVGLGGRLARAPPQPVPADSLRFLLGFLASLVAGTRLCAATPPGLARRFPPLGVALAGFYGAVLFWYAEPREGLCRGGGAKGKAL